MTTHTQSRPVTETGIDSEVYTHFAEVLTYPQEDYHRLIQQTRALVESQVNAPEPFLNFVSETGLMEVKELEELYTRTFDLNEKRPLEVGWHLYGERYQRGEFLVQMRDQLREYDIPESRELPDHLTHCLRLLGRMNEGERQEFISDALLPAVKSIRDGFKEENPYLGAIEMLLRILQTETGGEEQ